MYGHMGAGWAGWWVWLFWIIVIALLVFVVFRLASAGGSRRFPPGPETAEDILKKRYARGEIDKQEYETRLQDLRRTG